MDRELRVLLLSGAALVALAVPLQARAQEPSTPSAAPQVVEPQVKRREVNPPALDTENFEAGAFVGTISIEDFGSSFVWGGRLAYHFTEDVFAEATVGTAKAGQTSYEDLSGSAQLLTNDERQFTYYDLSLGWNALPGEVFLGGRRAMPSAVYFTLGAGSTDFITALREISLHIEPGELVAVMDPSGCGKSTLLHLIGGLDRPTSGRVLLDGQDLAALDDNHLTEIRRRKVGFVFQFFNLIPVLSALENAALPLMLDGIKPAEAKQRAQEWLERVGLVDRLEHGPDQLSGGQQQRVAMARALSTEPALILADEPTGNLDSRAGDEIANLVRQISDQWEQTILMVTHDPRSRSRRLQRGSRSLRRIKVDLLEFYYAV